MVFVLVVPPLGLMVNAVDWLASIVPLLIRVRLALPMSPEPWIVSSLVNVPPPSMMFFSLLPIMSVPVPLRVVLPAITSVVLLPVPCRLMAPLLVIVPAPRARPSLLGISKLVPVEIVTPVSVGRGLLQTFMLSITPPELEVKVPPVILTAFSSTVEAVGFIPPLVPVARIVPPVFVIVFSSCNTPPAVASSNPVFVVDPVVVDEAKGLIVKIAPGAFASTIPLVWLTKSMPLPLPSSPAPEIVLLTFVNVSPEVPTEIELPVLPDMVTLPLPVSVTFPPVITSWVLLPLLWRLMVPLLVMVPAPRARPLLLGMSKVLPLEIVTPVRVGRLPLQTFTLSITPPELEVKVPPVMLTLFSSTVPPVASISPDPFAMVEPLNSRVPPEVASSVPLFVVPPLGLICSVVDNVASMVPLLTRVRSPLPMVPAPWMVSPLVSVPPPVMMLFALLPIVTVPVPLRVVLPAITSSVLLPVPCRLMAPLFVMVPAPRARPSLLRTFTVLPLEIVTPVSVGKLPLQTSTLSITPPELEVKVPPVMLTLFSSTVELVPIA